MLGKLIKQRYYIDQFLSAGAFGRTYIAEDTHRPGNPKCIVKHISPTILGPRHFRTVRRRVISEAETLKHLGHHSHIPKLLDCFYDGYDFYLVQQFIQGYSLGAELPMSKGCLKLWSEVQVLKMLQEVLQILEFVHTQGIIHCDLKPNNIIRRTADGRLFLIDFGAVQLVRPYKTFTDKEDRAQMPLSNIGPLGFIAPEQLIGYPQPNSDIYALGMIAIQALTGIEPTHLKAHRKTGEVVWEEFWNVGFKSALSYRLVCVLNKMVARDWKNRYQSASEVLSALPQMPNSQQTKKAYRYNTNLLEAKNRKLKKHDFLSFILSKRSPLAAGMALGIAVNTLVIALGLYSLMDAFASMPEIDVLNSAKEDYQAGDFEQAIALAQSIPENSPNYLEAQAALQKWRQEWQLATAQFNAVQEAFNRGEWLDVLNEANNVPNISYWESKINPIVEIAKEQLEKEGQYLLQKAFERAESRDFTVALEYLRQIHPQTSIGEKVQQKLVEYNKKQSIKAEYLLLKAQQRAGVKDFRGAISLIKEIPEETAAYAKAKAKIGEYTQKQRLETEISTRARTLKPNDQVFFSTFEDINPGNRLQETTTNSIVKN